LKIARWSAKKRKRFPIDKDLNVLTIQNPFKGEKLKIVNANTQALSIRLPRGNNPKMICSNMK
jgi:hypothetical protein